MQLAMASQTKPSAETHSLADEELAGQKLNLLLVMKSGVALGLILIAGLLIWVLQDVPFLSAAKNDEATVQAFTTYGGARLGDDAESFEATGRFFGAISAVLDLKLFLFLTAAASIGAAVSLARSIAQLAAIALYTFIAVLLDMSYVSKDLIVVLCGAIPLLLIVLSARLQPRSQARWMNAALWLSVLLLAVYGITIRKYYLLIVPVALGLLWTRRFPWYVKTWLYCSAALIVLVGFPEQVGEIQALRDEVNVPRIFHPTEGGRSAFLNPAETDSVTGVLANLGYAIARIFLPVAFGATVKDLIFEPFLILVLYCCVCGFLRGSTPAAWGSSIVLAYLMVAMLFEPDVGSFARHASSLFPFAALAIAARPTLKSERHGIDGSA
jgi:hypothetical protein